jgi:hypothetical protein
MPRIHTRRLLHVKRIVKMQFGVPKQYAFAQRHQRIYRPSRRGRHMNGQKGCQRIFAALLATGLKAAIKRLGRFHRHIRVIVISRQ